MTLLTFYILLVILLILIVISTINTIRTIKKERKLDKKKLKENTLKEAKKYEDSFCLIILNSQIYVSISVKLIKCSEEKLKKLIEEIIRISPDNSLKEIYEKRRKKSPTTPYGYNCLFIRKSLELERIKKNVLISFGAYLDPDNYKYEDIKDIFQEKIWAIDSDYLDKSKILDFVQNKIDSLG